MNKAGKNQGEIFFHLIQEEKKKKKYNEILHFMVLSTYFPKQYICLSFLQNIIFKYKKEKQNTLYSEKQLRNNVMSIIVSLSD